MDVMTANPGWMVALLVLAVGCSTEAPNPAPVVPTAPAATPAATPSAELWRPRPGASWQLQLTGAIDARGADIVDVDGHETSAAEVAALHASGKRVICYFNAGGWEDWRPDRDAFPPALIGRNLDDWPGERWLDIREVEVLMPIMAARMDECREKGFDAVDPDNLDGWQADSGFPLTSADSLAYLGALSAAAHDRGLAIGLKNGVELIDRALPLVEFAVNEECLAYRECAAYAPFLAAGKAVFHVEYSGSISSICSRVPAGFASIRKRLELAAWVERCSP